MLQIYAALLILWKQIRSRLKRLAAGRGPYTVASSDKLRLMTKVARMYYSQGIQQTEITERLNIHQSTVSRLLRKAHESGIVRISVTVPSGIHSELEEALESRFDLREAIVVDSVSSEESQIARDLGSAGAQFLEFAAKPGEVIGISSWSASLLEMIKAMHPAKSRSGTKVVQILGGVGNPAAQTHATHLAERLAHLLGGSAVLLPVPSVTTSLEAKKVLLREAYVKTAMELFSRVDLVLVGIGAVEPSRLLASSGNVFSGEELNKLRKQGAVGDICLQFFDASGAPVRTDLTDRVIGISLAQMKRAKRVVALAGGKRKMEAILGALNGRWINVLITDHATAKAVLDASKEKA